MSELSLLTAEFKRWNGYCEKNNTSSLGASMSAPEGFTTKAGDGNYTIFAKDYAKWTGINVQGQAWCDTFVDSVFIFVLGVERAKELLGGFSAYTPTSANYFKNKSRFYTSNPQAGDIVFFKNDVRINHTGFVYQVSGSTIYTVEGNTSTGSAVVANGGQVAMKSYATSNSRIAGYGRPNYNDVAVVPPSDSGWVNIADPSTNKGVWTYVKDNGMCVRNTFAECNGLKYYFNSDGHMVTGQVIINGERHVFSEDGFEGAELLINDTVEFREVSS